MKKIKTRIQVFGIVFLVFNSLILSAQTTSELIDKLRQNADVVSVRKIEHHAFFKEAYELDINQYLDHKNPSAGTFTQRVFFSHYNSYSPMILVTEGYHADYAATPKYINELSRVIEANQLVVEHRFFGASTPRDTNWTYLTVENAMGDLHHIVSLFKSVLPKTKWISTGISKGGQTTLAYKAFYPNDVDIWVPYVAPNNFKLEETRHTRFLEKVGEKSTRYKISEFQLNVLKNRQLIEPLFDSIVSAQGLNFRIPNHEILDYCVLEFPFSFWQWGEQPNRIPSWNNNPKEMLNYLIEISPLDYFDVEKMKPIRPFFIQAAKELGYYGYDIKPLKKYLIIGQSKDYIKKIFLGTDENFKFDKTISVLIEQTVARDGDHILLIYGEYDPWSASALMVPVTSKAKKFVIPKADHKVRIEKLTYEQKANIYKLLESWLDE